MCVCVCAKDAARGGWACGAAALHASSERQTQTNAKAVCTAVRATEKLNRFARRLQPACSLSCLFALLNYLVMPAANDIRERPRRGRRRRRGRHTGARCFRSILQTSCVFLFVDKPLFRSRSRSRATSLLSDSASAIPPTAPLMHYANCITLCAWS